MPLKIRLKRSQTISSNHYYKRFFSEFQEVVSMNKKQALLEQMIALSLLAYVIGI
jgi:hypothetical protein